MSLILRMPLVFHGCTTPVELVLNPFYLFLEEFSRIVHRVSSTYHTSQLVLILPSNPNKYRNAYYSMLASSASMKCGAIGADISSADMAVVESSRSSISICCIKPLLYCHGICSPLFNAAIYDPIRDQASDAFQPGSTELRSVRRLSKLASGYLSGVGDLRHIHLLLLVQIEPKLYVNIWREHRALWMSFHLCLNWPRKPLK